MNPEMKDAQKQQDLLLKNSIEQSIGTGIYQTNTVKTSARPVYPWAPTVRIQKRGASLVDDASLIDVDSEMMNINRINSLDPLKQYIPPDQEKRVNYRDFEDGFFHSDSTRLTNPAMDLRGMTKSNFDPIFFDPQENVIEPDFIGKRTGINTHLSLVDDFQECFETPIILSPQ